MEAHFEVFVDPSRSLLVLRGECDMDEVVRIQDAVDRLPDLGSLDLVIDVGGLTFIGSAGLAELIRLNAACATVVLRDIPRQLRTLLEVTGMDDTFDARQSAQT